MTTGVCVTTIVLVFAGVGVGFVAAVRAGLAGAVAVVGVVALPGVGAVVAVVGPPPVGVGWIEPFPVGRSVVTDGDGLGGGDDEQPETAAKPRTASTQPADVSSARGVVGVRTFFRYPAG